MAAPKRRKTASLLSSLPPVQNGARRNFSSVLQDGAAARREACPSAATRCPSLVALISAGLSQAVESRERGAEPPRRQTAQLGGRPGPAPPTALPGSRLPLPAREPPHGLGAPAAGEAPRAPLPARPSRRGFAAPPTQRLAEPRPLSSQHPCPRGGGNRPLSTARFAPPAPSSARPMLPHFSPPSTMRSL